MGVDEAADLERKMGELNLAASLKRRSPRTGYVHFHSADPLATDTIPLLENFCFVLALFRSKVLEHVAEGKELLEKLLFFEVEGNFPIYLHEYPQCKDRDLSLDILPCIHFILQECGGSILGPLSCRLQELICRILSHAYRIDRERPLSPPSLYRVKSYVEPSSLPVWTPSSASEWAHGLISYQMALSLNHSIPDFFFLAKGQWNFSLAFYLGAQGQRDQEPEVTLFDLIMGYQAGRYAKRALYAERVHLQSSLIYPFPISHQMIEESQNGPVSTSEGIYWGSLDKLHSLSIESSGVLASEGSLEWSIEWKEELVQEKVELSFYVNADAFQGFLVQGSPATTFQLGDELAWMTDGIKWRCIIDQTQGSGRFFGHLLKGNRSKQKNTKVYTAQDWQIALRTLKRSPDCKLRVRLIAECETRDCP